MKDENKRGIFSGMREKIKNFNFKKLLCMRNYVIVGCCALLVTALVIGTVTGSKRNEGETSVEELLGNSALTELNKDQSTDTDAGKEEEKDDFFAAAVINRRRARDEAMDALYEITEDPSALAETKNSAHKSIENIVSAMKSEADIETLIKAKGFKECVAVISDAKCSIIVKSEKLEQKQVAQILDIVLENSSVTAQNIKIILKA